MKRKPAAPIFKPYTMAQPSLIPPSWDELIPADHLVTSGEPGDRANQPGTAAEEVQRGRDEQLSSGDDAEGVGVCVHTADLLIAADSEGGAGERELSVVEWGESAGLSDDQRVSRGEDERGDRGSIHAGAGAAGGRGVCEAGELLCGWDEDGSECEPAQGGVGEEPGEIPGAVAGEGEGTAERDRCGE